LDWKNWRRDMATMTLMEAGKKMKEMFPNEYTTAECVVRNYGHRDACEIEYMLYTPSIGHIRGKSWRSVFERLMFPESNQNPMVGNEQQGEESIGEESIGEVNIA